eukprot:Awhi_evm2s9562
MLSSTRFGFKYAPLALRACSMSSVAINTVAVVGSGQMGGGIAQASACAGYKVILIDTQEDILKKNLAIIEKSLTRVAKKKYKDEAEVVIININIIVFIKHL